MITVEKVKELIAKQLNKPIEEITEDKDFVKDLGADSLDIVEMSLGLEEEFDISIPESEPNIKTVGDIIKLIGAE